MNRDMWRPRREDLEKSNLAKIIQKGKFSSYDDFLHWSVSNPEGFWKSFFEETDFKWQVPYSKTLDTSDGIAWARWFVGGKTNLTYNALDRHILSGKGERIALLCEGEEGISRKYTYRDLLDEVNRLSNALLKLGVKKGDRVGLFLPMIPEVAVSLLAISRIGAIVVPIFSGFGPEAILIRLKESRAKFLITTDGFLRRGKVIKTKETAEIALSDSPDIEKVIVVRRLGLEFPITERDVLYDEIVQGESSELDATPFESDTPFMVIFTSGTTGKPKGAVHVHAGFPIKAAQDIYHLFDLKEDDVFYWLTDIGWMMGPWLILGGLILGSTLVFYDGSPDHPEPDRMWKIFEKYRVQVAGISPTFIRHISKFGEEWVERYSFESLRILGSTGEPWNPDPWMWTFKKVGKGRVPIINYSGGTEISGGILGCTVLKPIAPCSFNTVVPGIDADVVDEKGNPVEGEVGLLVIRNPNPGMTRGFWEDPARYEETYWNRFKGLWYHGDLVLKDGDFWYILGRADDTLKVAGKRVGPAEIESVLVESGDIVEAAVIGVPDEIKGQVPVAFVVPKPECESTEEKARELKEFVASKLGKTLVPKLLYFVSDLPKTRNAKVMRRVIKAVFLGKDPGDISALENPEALQEIGKLKSA